MFFDNFYLRIMRVLSEHPYFIVFVLGLTLICFNLFYDRKYFRVLLSLCVTYYVLVTYDSYSESVIQYVSNLGSDSFAEAQSFSIGEAYAFIRTLLPTLYTSDSLDLKATIVFALFLAALLFVLINYTLLRKYRSLFVGALVLVPLVAFAKFSWNKFNYNSDYYENLISNYTLSSNISTENQVDKSPKLVVFIGESTSALNLSLIHI